MTGLERNADVVRDGVLRAAVRARRRVAVDAEPDLVRQPALVRHAELLRAAAVRREPRRDRAADYARREARDGAGRALRERRDRSAAVAGSW